MITAAQVFEYMGTEDAKRQDRTAMVTGLIQRVAAEVETIIGRKITQETVTNVPLMRGQNCRIYGNKIYLLGRYHDLFKITKIMDQTIDVPVTDVVLVGGVITHKHRAWPCESYSIVISGSLGYVSADDPAKMRPDIEQVVLDIVAAKSGLWVRRVEAEDGQSVEVERHAIPSDTLKALKRHRLRFLG